MMGYDLFLKEQVNIYQSTLHQNRATKNTYLMRNSKADKIDTCL